jgi:hypothetical protein
MKFRIILIFKINSKKEAVGEYYNIQQRNWFGYWVTLTNKSSIIDFRSLSDAEQYLQKFVESNLNNSNSNKIEKTSLIVGEYKYDKNGKLVK